MLMQWLMVVLASVCCVGVNVFLVDLVAGFDESAAILVLLVEQRCLGVVLLQMRNIVFLHLSVNYWINY
jgi:hypothetical protein